jgi:hypothetical protein
MNYLKPYQIFEKANVTDDPIQIITKLNRYKKVKYTLNKDNSIDVEGDVDISFLELTEMPVKFGKVTGDFYCFNNKLTSLENAPITVTGNFNCYRNQLTSLKHCPTTVTRYFDCSFNKLTSLEHCPKTVTGNFYVSFNKFPEDIQKNIDNFKGTWQELLFLMNIWQSKKLTDLDNKTGLFN